MNQSFKYEFINVSFYEYTIRMTIINNTKMYLVSDILKQYNKINNTDKRIHDWLKRKDTRELIQSIEEQNSNEIFASSRNNEEDFSNITGVIMKIDYKINDNITNKAYLVNGAILHDILIWVDKIFAYKVYNFLDNMREINNDRFVEILNSNKEKDKQIELLQEQLNQYEQENKQLKSRYTPEEYNWHFCVAYNELTNIATTVITKDQYQPADKNIKRLYDLICPNPLVLEQQLLDILANDNRFTQISNKEFRTIIDSKHIFWYFKSKCKKLRTNLEWKTGLIINEVAI